jgi:hypothetical protein
LACRIFAISVTISGIFFLLVLALLNGQAFSQTATGQFKKYNEQYGRFSIRVPNNWTIGSPHIKQDSVLVSFDPKWADVIFSVGASDSHSTLSEADYQQVIREDNAATVADLPGAKMIQDTDCTKYFIDGNKACSMIYILILIKDTRQKSWIYLFVRLNKMSTYHFRDPILISLCRSLNKCLTL